jgi:hypothetical protein
VKRFFKEIILSFLFIVVGSSSLCAMEQAGAKVASTRWADMIESDTSEEEEESSAEVKEESSSDDEEYFSCVSTQPPSTDVALSESDFPIIGNYSWSSDYCKQLNFVARGGRSRVRDFSFSPSGNFSLVSLLDGSLKVLNGLSGECLEEVRTSVRNPIGFIVKEDTQNISILIGDAISNHRNVAYCYPERRRFLFKRDGAIDVFDLNKTQTTLTGVSRSGKISPRKVLFLADGEHVAVGYSHFKGGEFLIKRIDIYDVNSGCKFTLPSGFQPKEKDVFFKQSFIFNGEVFFFMQCKNDISLWNVTKCKMVFKKRIVGTNINVHADLGNPNYFYVTYNRGGKGLIEHCSSITGEVLRTITVGELKNFAVSNFGLIGFICKDDQKKVYIRSVFSGGFFTLSHDRNAVKVIFSPSGLSCVVVLTNGQYIWNLFEISEYKNILPERAKSLVETNHAKIYCGESVTVNLIEDTVLAL